MNRDYADAGYEEWKGWAPADFGRHDAREDRAFRMEYGRVDGRRVLEIGFGNGHLLKWFHDCGARVEGVEANPELVRRAAAQLGAASLHDSIFAAALDARAGTFDLVVAIDVLEHVPEDAMHAFLARIAALLAPDGRVVMRYPNGDSPFGRIWQHGDVTHRTTIGHQKMHYFARRAGLAVTALRAPAEPLLGHGARTAVVRAARRALRGAIDRTINAVYFQNAGLPMTPLVVCEMRRAPRADAGEPATSCGSST